MGSFVERKIFKCTYIYMSHQTLLSCLNCIILISVFFTNGMFYFGPFYLTACETTPSWQNCSRKQYVRQRCNSSLGGIAIFITDFCYGLSFISTFLSEYFKPRKPYQLMPVLVSLYALPWYRSFKYVRPQFRYHQPPVNSCAHCPLYKSLSRSFVLNAMPSCHVNESPAE